MDDEVGRREALVELPARRYEGADVRVDADGPVPVAEDGFERVVHVRHVRVHDHQRGEIGSREAPKKVVEERAVTLPAPEAAVGCPLGAHAEPDRESHRARRLECRLAVVERADHLERNQVDTGVREDPRLFRVDLEQRRAIDPPCGAVDRERGGTRQRAGHDHVRTVDGCASVECRPYRLPVHLLDPVCDARVAQP